MNKMNKKYLPYIIGALVLLLALGGGVFAYTRMNAKDAQQADEAKPKKKKTVEPVNVIAVADRPYIQIAPTDASHVDLIVKELKKPATEMEYELEYQTGTLLQAAFDAMKLDSLPAVKNIYFGSCSAGGACTTHTDIKGGSLLTRFKGGSENYALKSDWTYLDNKAKAGEIESKDGKFMIESADLRNQRFMIVFNTAGFPKGLEGTPVSDPYSFAVSANLKGKGTITIEPSETAGVSIMGWNGQDWTELATTAEGSKVSAQGDLMELYIAVKK